MNHIIFKQSSTNTYKSVILIKSSALDKQELQKYYVDHIKDDSIFAMDLEYNDQGKCPVGKVIKPYLKTLLKALKGLKTKYLYVCDASYFKALTKLRKTDGALGYIHPCKIDGYEDLRIILGVNYKNLFYDPSLQKNLDISLAALNNVKSGKSIFNKDILHSKQLPETFKDISSKLEELHKYPEITCDIEARSLEFYNAGIESIAFSWDEHNGLGILVDRNTYTEAIKPELKRFFENYTGTVIYHNCSYDIKVLIYELFMKDITDITGMLHGLDTMYKSIHDTKILAYLCTNSTSGNELGLKKLAYEFAGNYAEDVKNIERITSESLLEYNIKDCLSTFFIYKKYIKQLYEENQQDVYQNVMLPSVKTLTHIELMGMPIDLKEVHNLKTSLENQISDTEKEIFNSGVIKNFEASLRTCAVLEKNSKLKVKRVSVEDFKDLRFNPGSNKQVSKLLFEFLKYEVIDTTDTGEPAVSGKALTKLKNKITNTDHLKIVDGLLVLTECKKILNTFIKAFLNKSKEDKFGTTRLYGNYNVTGTVSGRTSSNSPNLQNLPSGSTYGKQIKKCFIAPEGYLMVGADSDSLEDKISALTTKDPNKLKVYTGHTIYELNINGTCHHIRDDADIIYDGKSYTGAEFYTKYSNN